MLAAERAATDVRCPTCGERLQAAAKQPQAAVSMPKGGRTHASEGTSAASAGTRRQEPTLKSGSRPTDRPPQPPAALPPPLPPSTAPQSGFPGWPVIAGCGFAAVIAAGLLISATTQPFGPNSSPIPNAHMDEFVVDSRTVQPEKRLTREPKPSSRSESASPVASQTAKDSPQPSAPSAEPPPPQLQANSGLTKGDAVAEALPSVAVVQVSDGHGSGFVAAPHFLVTNYHVIKSSRLSDVRVSFPDNRDVGNRRFTAELVAENPMYDIAVLRVNCDVAPLRLQEEYRHSNGQKIVAIGSPGTGGSGASDILPNLTTPGRLGPPYKLANGAEWWALSMAINPGNSGGPIIDENNGQVVGVAVAGFNKTQSQSLAVPHPAIMEIIRKAQVATADDVRRELFLHRARFCLAHMSRLLSLIHI